MYIYMYKFPAHFTKEDVSEFDFPRAKVKI